MIYCRRCGKALPADSLFCPSCGQSRTAPTAPAVDPQQPVYSLADKLPGLIMLPLLFVVSLIWAASTPLFSDLQFVLLSAGVNMIFATGMIIAARAKGPDVSLGATASLAAAITALNSQQGDVFSGIVIALFVALLIGALNGALTVYLKLPSVLVTLATTFAVYAITYAVLKGETAKLADASFAIGRDAAVIAVIMLLMAGLLYLFMFATPLGQPLRQKSSADTQTIDFIAYIVASLLFAFGGIILLSRIQAASSTLCVNYHFDMLMILFLCGGSVFFEKKSLLPVIVLLYSLIMALILTTFNFSGMDSASINIVFGVILFIALIFDRIYKYNIVSQLKK